MKWITATHLQQWAKRLDARPAFIEMIADLIRASNDEISHFRFPGGDKGQVRGFDGDLETSQKTTYVPDGLSKWEFGVTPGSSKARNDFIKRNTETSTEDKKLNTLVLVNLNTWDDPGQKLPDWISEIKQGTEWRDIKYIDGVQLEHWLDDHPAVAARYAKDILGIQPKDGIQSLDEYWASYSHTFKPALSEQVLLCERESQVKEMLEALMGNPQLYMLGAEAPEDVIAFAVAAIRTADPDIRLFLESRTLVVETTKAAKELSNKKDMVFLLKGTATNDAGLLSQTAPTLTASIGPQGRKPGPKLLRPSASALGKALTLMGYNQEEGYKIALECGRSITVLQRRLSNGPVVDPEWAGLGEVLLPAMLAGGWSTRSMLDKDLLKALSSSSKYEEFEKKLRTTLDMRDPPIDQVEDTWVMRSQVDAFPYFQNLIGQPEYDLLRDSAIKVLSSEIKKPDPKAPYSQIPPENYSSWLREGLANTLLQIVTIANDTGIKIPNNTPQRYVNDIVEALPGWGKSHTIFKRIAEQLLTLAEAAPDSFLNALESLLEGDSAEIQALFTDSDTSLFAPTSLHTYLLWALEMLAWDPKYLHKASISLLKLAARDPGGKTSNRPLNSLRSILLPWSPNTYGSLKERLACLDLLLGNDQNEGWKLLVALLPKSHDSTSPTSLPRMRDIKPRYEEVLTYADVWENQSHIVGRCIELAGENEERIQVIIEHLSHFSPDDQARSLDLIENYLIKHVSFEGNKVWFSLRDEVHKHEYFHEAEWALKPESLIKYKELVQSYAPEDPLTSIGWLFDDWIPHVGVYEEFAETDLEKERTDAVIKVYKELGMRGIVRLIGLVKLPHLVMGSIEAAKFEQPFYEELLLEFLKIDPVDKGLISMLSGSGIRLFGTSWADFVFYDEDTQPLDEDTIVSLVINWPNQKQTWETIHDLGSSINTKYWLAMSGMPREGSPEEFNYVGEKLLSIGRPLTAIYTFYDRLPLVESRLLMNILFGAVSEINQNPERLNNMFSYYLEKILVQMRTRADISLEEVARVEYAYITFLHRDAKDLVIHDLMAQDPKFYMELIINVFRASNNEPREVTEQDRGRATSSYELLSSFTKLPGQSGTEISVDTLSNWMVAVRQLANELDRVDITDQYIGHILAHAPVDTDGAWPHKSIRKVIESFRSIQIERGLVTERFNMRGVWRKEMNEGGEQERGIAANYRKWALAMPEFPHTAALLYKIEEDWILQAERADIEAEKRKLKH